MNFSTLSQRIGYQFINSEVLRQACTHKSFVNEHADAEIKDNERLEFLGDAVLDLVVSDLLMERFPDLPEGGLTKLRASLVSESGLSKIAEAIDLGKFILLGKGEELTGGREKKSILSSTFEALIAAIYIDSREQGLNTVRKVIQDLFENEIPSTEETFFPRDYKTELQEYVQKRFHTISTYKLYNASGPDHEKEFEVAALIDDREYGRGKGSSKKQAEQVAAKEALSQLKSTEMESVK
ncbi:MAG: ribonuclease III [SAR324 cluster bacterium]|nr:ribonuclease III [SAR324 cluster bacterium]